MFSLAVGVITCCILTLGPNLVHGAPSEPSHLERRIDPDNVAMYTPDVSTMCAGRTRQFESPQQSHYFITQTSLTNMSSTF
jgi:hypothetical protein